MSGKIVRPLGNIMRDPEAKRVASLPKLPHADAAVAMAFALKDGSLNLPTQSIVGKISELYHAGLAPLIFSFGSGRNKKDDRTEEEGITEAEAMARGLIKLGVNKKDIINIENPEDSDFTLKDKDFELLGQRLEELNIRSSYLVAHPLQLWRARLRCKKISEKRFLDVSFHPVEAKRIYDRGSYQFRCRAEIFFIPWNIAAFAEHFYKGKI